MATPGRSRKRTKNRQVTGLQTTQAAAPASPHEASHNHGARGASDARAAEEYLRSLETEAYDPMRVGEPIQKEEKGSKVTVAVN